MKSIYWSLKVLNPINNEVLLNEEHPNIDEIAEKYSYLPHSTWKNIGMGRCKIYNRFINLEKCYKSEDKNLSV